MITKKNNFTKIIYLNIFSPYDLRFGGNLSAVGRFFLMYGLKKIRELLYYYQSIKLIEILVEK